MNAGSVVITLSTGRRQNSVNHYSLSPDAPYKVGKPWHDEIEVVVRRALEQRDVARRLTASVVDALSMSNFDDELAKTESPLELSEAVVRRAHHVKGRILAGPDDQPRIERAARDYKVICHTAFTIVPPDVLHVFGTVAIEHSLRRRS